MPLTLRPYQREAIDAPFRYFEQHTGNPLIVVPTGGGKSIIIGTFIREAIERYPVTRILIMQHVQELIEQNFNELLEVWPEAPAGIYSAGLGLRQIGAQILFAGIQSIHDKAEMLGHFDLVLVDEAHMIPRASDTVYQKLLRALLKINPYLKLAGFTATPFRLDSGMLHKGEGAMFDAIAYEVPIRLLFDEGYLCPLVTPKDLGFGGSLPQIDTTKIGTRAGDFKAAELDAASTDPETVRLVCDSIVQHGHDRAGWLIFGAGTQHCADLHQGLAERGFTGGVIFGNTPNTKKNPERKRLIEAFKRRELRYLVSLGVLTTGFNARHVDLLACARPTKSTVLYIQMLGRATRCIGADVTESIENGKANALVLDFGGNIDRHGPIDAPNLKKLEPGEKKPGEPDAPKRACMMAPVCPEMNPIGLRFCAACGAPYPDVQTFISTEASNASIMSAGQSAPPVWVPVDRVSYSRHDKPSSPASMKVTYQCGLLKYHEWVLLEHTGFPRDKAIRWWAKRTGSRAAPGCVDDALKLTRMLRKPTHIALKPAKEGSLMDIVGVQLGERAQMEAA